LGVVQLVEDALGILVLCVQMLELLIVLDGYPKYHVALGLVTLSSILN
jgi:hypothetical protein